MQRDNTGRLALGLMDSLIRHRIPVAFIVFVSMSVAAVASILEKPTYEAHSSLLLTFGREYVYRPEVGEEVDSQLMTRPNEVVNSEVQILSSRELRINLIDEIGAENIFPELLAEPTAATGLRASLAELKSSIGAAIDLVKDSLRDAVSTAAGLKQPAPADPTDPMKEQALKLLEENLRIERAKEANVIHIYFASQHKDVANEVVSRYLQLLAKKRLSIYGESQLPFFESQLSQYRQALESAESRLQAVKDRYEVYDPVEQTRLILGQITNHEKEIMTSSNLEIELDDQIAELVTQLGLMPENVPLYVGINTEPIRLAVKRMQGLRDKEADLLAKNHSSGNKANGELKAVQLEIEKLKRHLDQQKKDLGSRVWSGKSDLFKAIEVEFYRQKANLTAVKSRIATQRRQLDDLREQLRRIDLGTIEIEKLRREKAFHERNFEEAARKLEEVRLSSELDQQQQSNIRVIQKPIASKVEGLPKALRVILGGLFGLVAGLGLGLYRDTRSGMFYRRDQLEARFGIPVFASLAER